MKDLSIALVQTALHWEDASANLAMLEEKIWSLNGGVDVIVLPEMFNSGFTMHAERVAEKMNMRTTKWLKQMAAQTGALILGSVIIEEDNKYYNRLCWAEPNGRLMHYDKKHLFRMAGEHKVFSPGKDGITGEWCGWRIRPLVCYDLRFPVWSRNTWDNASKRPDYDLLVYVANWPSARSIAWDTLLKARAIENLSFAAGVNRVGTDGNQVEYNGHSALIGPRGEEIIPSFEQEAVKVAKLHAEELHSYREKFPAFMDADGFRLEGN